MSRVCSVIKVLYTVGGGCNVIAERALLYHSFFSVVLTHSIRAGINAVLATYAPFLINEHNIVILVTI
jgi:hypothetical protein